VRQYLHGHLYPAVTLSSEHIGVHRCAAGDTKSGLRSVVASPTKNTAPHLPLRRSFSSRNTQPSNRHLPAPGHLQLEWPRPTHGYESPWTRRGGLCASTTLASRTFPLLHYRFQLTLNSRHGVSIHGTVTGQTRHRLLAQAESLSGPSPIA
jgi:hypothetical protein